MPAEFALAEEIDCPKEGDSKFPIGAPGLVVFKTFRAEALKVMRYTRSERVVEVLAASLAPPSPLPGPAAPPPKGTVLVKDKLTLTRPGPVP